MGGVHRELENPEIDSLLTLPPNEVLSTEDRPDALFGFRGDWFRNTIMKTRGRGPSTPKLFQIDHGEISLHRLKDILHRERRRQRPSPSNGIL